MQTVFLELVKLSLIGSLFAAAVMLVRLIFHKAPKWLFCVLWGVVALRLICPVSIESNVSLVPDRLASGQIITNVGNEYIGDVDIIYESNAGYSNAVEAGRQPVYSNDGYYVVTEKDSFEAPKTVGETVYPILSWIWVAGVVLMLAYTAVSYLLLRKKMEEATQLRDNIWQCEQVDSPFVLGFIKPRIYLPYAITDSDMANVIAHEQAHIQRKDHWWKPIGFLLLSIHWFNPVLWLAYILLCRDIEAACDEKVIKHMEKDEMRAYSTALLHCSVHRRRIAACPLAFGETGVKERIKRVMNYRKPAFWVILLALIASAVACVLLLTNPSAKNTTLMGANYRVTDVLYSTASEDDDRYSRFLITADYVLYAQLEGDDSWCIHEKMEAYPLTAKELQEYTTNKNGWKENYRIQDITDAYICRKENDWFYLAAQTKNGDTLIGVGWEDVSERGQGASDDTYLRYLYKVESEFTENEFNVNFFVHSLYEALGVTDCFEAYTNEDNPGFIVVGFMSDYNDQAEHDYNDMGFAVFQSQNNGYRLLDYHVYENAANQNEGIVFCDHPAVMSLDGSMDHNVTFDVIISCNTKLDKIQREYYKDDKLSKQIASTHLGGGKSMTLFRWDEMVGSNLRIKQYYLDSEGNEIAFEEYGEAVNYDNLIAMVQDIAHNPNCAASSNPFDFIEAKRPLYNEILSYGSSAVDCFVDQLRSGENGLQGYIMAVACADITGIGDKDLGADWATAQEWLALYDKKASNIASIHSQIYAVKEVTYESGVYSFTIVAGENSPFYVLTEDMVLASQKEVSEEGIWANLGKMETVELSKENFDDLFKHPGNWADNTDAKSIRDNTQKAWQLIYNQDVLYYILQQKNGDLYLAYGYTGFSNNDANAAHIRWLYKLSVERSAHAGMVATSGHNTVPMVLFPKETPIKDCIDDIHWLTINPFGDDFVPFNTAENGVVIFGMYTAYDAETLEPLKHIVPSGLSPQTYLFQNADPDREYIVFADFGDKGNYAFGVRFGDENSALDSLKRSVPEYFNLDHSHGLDVYVWQMAKNNYNFGLLPHTETLRDWISAELMNLKGISVEDMRLILDTYGIDQEDIHVIPWQNPLSSYLGEYWIVMEGEDMEQKRSEYVQNLRNMLFAQE